MVLVEFLGKRKDYLHGYLGVYFTQPCGKEVPYLIELKAYTHYTQSTHLE